MADLAHVVIECELVSFACQRDSLASLDRIKFDRRQGITDFKSPGCTRRFLDRLLAALGRAVVPVATGRDRRQDEQHDHVREQPDVLHTTFPFGGCPPCRQLLSNVTYTGQIRYRNEVYPGEHPALM
jgi:hypothetical protein